MRFVNEISLMLLKGDVYYNKRFNVVKLNEKKKGGKPPKSEFIQLYVSSVNGNDRNSGKEPNNALKTIEAALGLTVSYKRKRIILIDDFYYITNTIKITTSNLDLIGASTKKPRISSTIPLNKDNCIWKKMDDHLIYCKLSSTILSYLNTFSTLYVNGEGTIRARFPDVSSPFDHLYHSKVPSRWGKSASLKPIRQISRQIDPVDDPNVKYISGSPKYNRFSVGYLDPSNTNTFNPPVSYFFASKNEADGGCPYSLPTSASWSSGTPLPQEEYNIPNNKTCLIHVEHFYGWGSWTFYVNDISRDTVTFGHGGWQEARGDCGLGGKGWWIEGLLEFLDSPDEFFLDLNNGTLYFYPPNDSKNPLLVNTLKMEIGVKLDKLIQINGASGANPNQNIRIQNLHLFGAYATTMERFEVPSGGDWSFYRSGALHVENSVNVLIDDVKFSWLGGNGLVISKRCDSIIVQFCDFYALGSSAIVIAGDPEFNSREPWSLENTPKNIFIENNIISDIGLHVKQSGALFLTLSKNVFIRNNVLFRSPRSGICFNDQFEQGNIVENNIIFEMVLETKDHGPLIIWNRQGYVIPREKKPDIIQNNLFLGLFDDIDGGKGVDLDDGSFNTIVTNNIIIWGSQKIKGSLIRISNNLIVYPNWRSCTVFSYFTRNPSGNTFRNNICQSNLPPYSFAIKTNPQLCLSKNFLASNNTFYYTGQQNFGGCIGTWNSWTSSQKQDKNSRITPPVSDEVLLFWIVQKLTKIGLLSSL